MKTRPEMLEHNGASHVEPPVGIDDVLGAEEDRLGLAAEVEDLRGRAGAARQPNGLAQLTLEDLQTSVAPKRPQGIGELKGAHTFPEEKGRA